MREVKLVLDAAILTADLPTLNQLDLAHLNLCGQATSFGSMPDHGFFKIIKHG
jgi:hypothetical protein